MTRPKVPPDQRQRTAQACESCKRRKQKCNGLCPCNTCEKRKFTCVYNDRNDPSSPSAAAHPAKKRMLEGDVEGYPASTTSNGGSIKSPAAAASSPDVNRQSSFSSQHRSSAGFAVLDPQPANSNANQYAATPTHGADESVENAARSLQQFSAPRSEDQSRKTSDPSQTNQIGVDEEAIVYSQTRMLQDPTGRLLYVGDSATLSFLQLIRMMVENVCGQSPFTTDPRRHKIMESQFSLPSNTPHSLLIPHKTTATILADAFFVNTHGLVHVFDRKAFYDNLDTTYSDPLSQDPNWLCLLNLVFAIGLMMAVPAPGTSDAAVIEKLRSEHMDRAEVFYLNAKGLNDPMTGLEDADFWSVQALLLMTVYMLAKSKRNTAFALLGMAIRSAYALGLHREETLIIFTAEDQAARRNVWRSLFVMDRFLSCSLGRPPGISEDDCSGDTLKPADPGSTASDFDLSQTFPGSASFAETDTHGLEAAVRSCSVVGKILRQIYQQRKVSTRLAQEIADICKLWPKALSPLLHWRQATTASPSQGIAILHTNLFYCHSIVLLTRPFFLFILNDILQQGQTLALNGVRSRRNYAKMEKFSEACVIASTHTIVLVQNAFEAGYLPRRNPFVIYFLFAAALIILSNEFALLYLNVAADQSIRNAITIMAYCADTDPQASRLLYILSTFRDVVLQQRDQRSRQQQQTNQLPPFNLRANINPYGLTGNNNLSPMINSQHNHQSNITLPPVPTSSSTYLPPSTNPLSQPPNQQPGTADSQQHADINIPNLSLPPHSNGGNNSSLPSTTQPMEPNLTSPAPPNPLSPHPPLLNSAPHTPHLGALDRLSFSNIFDLGVDRLSVSDESSGADEHIDFDALWAWPSNTPAVGTPKVTGLGATAGLSTAGEGSSTMQGANNSTVPLFGVDTM